MEKIGVIGSGTMGAGIAQHLAASGCEVVMHDVKSQYLEDGMERIASFLSRSVEKEKLTEGEKEDILEAITTSTDLKMMKDRDLIIEAATEDMDVKKKIFHDLDTICPEETIIATNTSALSITELATSIERPEKVLGIHFFNPVPLMELVECVRALTTDDEIYRKCCDFISSTGKEVVEVKESPGFIVNRILIPMINEAAFLLQNGVASAEDIDTAMKKGANHPIGPLALGDMIGLDVSLSIMETLPEEMGEDKYRPCQLLRRKVRAGHLGRKSGRGFYEYS